MSPLEEARSLLAASDLEDRCAGVARLAAVPGAAATRELAGLLEETSWFLRDRVVEALAERPGTLSAVRSVLREGSWFARASACDALGRGGDRDAMPAVLEQVEDRNVSLQKSAVEALEKLARSHGDEAVARLLAGLPPERRRRAVSRIGHQAPHWFETFEKVLLRLPDSAFRADPPLRTSVPEAAARSDRAETEAIVQFRRWLANLPVVEGKT